MLRERLEADAVVAGGGVAGLGAAVAAAELGARVVVLAGSPGASHWLNSVNCALGDSADDQPERLFDDMYRGGQYLNNVSMAALVAQRSGEEIRRLEALGVPFARDGSGALARRRAAGSTWTRAVFTQDMVGVEVMRVLRRELEERHASSVTFIEHGVVVDLQSAAGEIEAATGYDRRAERLIGIETSAVVLATGGAGALFARSTNQRGSNGTGYALAAKAGAELMDLEFVAFEPFVLSQPGEKAQSLPTTLMSEGAVLRNGQGEEFLPPGPLPNKDSVCRAMADEVREGRGTPSGSVVYDVTGVDEDIIGRYSKVARAVRSAGTTRLEVMPAQHYFMGGIRTDASGATNVPGLYALGEAAAGTHGAHRLAGCGGTEVIVMGPVVGAAAARWGRSRRKRRQEFTGTEADGAPLAGTDAASREERRAARLAVEKSCGIVRTGEELAAAEEALREIEHGRNARTGREEAPDSMLTLAHSLVASALARTESRGDHFRADHPHRDDLRWTGNLVITWGAGEEGRTVRFVGADGVGGKR